MKFFEDLQLVSLNDPYSLTLPVDPLDALDKIYSELPAYSPLDNDVLQVSQETSAYLKAVVKTGLVKSQTERIVSIDSYGPIASQEPFYPALTRRARASTRILGSQDVQRPSTFKDIFEESKLGVLEVEVVEEPTVELEDILQVKISIDPEEEPAVKSLLQSTLNVLRPEKPYTNRHLDSTSLCSRFPAEPTFNPPEDVFMPIFPRRLQIGNSVEPVDFKSLIENVSAPFEPVNVVNLDDDIPRQNLVLVGGWHAIKSSPPSTPSSKHSGDEETDELDDIRFPSSPCTTPPPVQLLENAKMDQVLIPRCRRIGGKGGIAPHILHGETLKSFLVPLLSQPQTEREGVVAERIQSPAPSSLIGQPPSALDIDHETETDLNDWLDFDIGLDIQKVCEGYDLEPDFFLHETIDEKAALLMEVPVLPQPNEFPKDFYVPKSFSDFVILSTAKGGQHQPNARFQAYRFLKKVSGCQSLSLVLSWVPFTTDKHPPTLLEILDVVDLFPQEGHEFNMTLKLLDSIAAESSSKSPTEVSVCRGLEAGIEDLIYEAPTEEFHIMLNKKERNCRDKHDGLASGCGHGDSASGNNPDIPDVNTLVQLQTRLVSSDISHVDAHGHGDPSDLGADVGRTLKKFKLDTHDNGSPTEFSDSRTQDFEPVARDDDLFLSNKKLRASYEDDVTSFRGSGGQLSGALADFDASRQPELATHSLGSFAFARLRARKVSVPRLEPTPVDDPVLSLPPRAEEQSDIPRGPPPELCDDNTIYLTEALLPQSVHKYMASLGLIQKRALVRALGSRNCAVELVERQDLDGVDLILDTDTAVVFLNLFSLPSRCDACVDEISKESWKYDRLLVVLEAYDELSAKKDHQRPSLPVSRPIVPRQPQPCAYTPPIKKAFKKLKRNLSIAEGCGTKRAATVIQYAFADTVEEAALFARLYGDWCEANDKTHGAIWGGRDWLDEDILEDEETNLTSLNGVNHFSASIILCQVSLQEFVDLLPEERVSTFGAYISHDRIRECNEDLAARFLSQYADADVGGTGPCGAP